jgi:hypothetical protein
MKLKELKWEILRDLKIIRFEGVDDSGASFQLSMDFETFDRLRREYLAAVSEKPSVCPVCKRAWEQHSQQELDDHMEMFLEKNLVDAG